MEAKYMKDELKESEKFKNRRDALEALLKDEVCYSIDEVEEILNKFMEGSV